MLETRKTFAEQMIQKLKKDREKNKINYVHPRNQINDGFLVVNYRKRNVIYKELMDGKIVFPVLEEWELLQKQDNLYIYGFAKEKELLAFKVTKDSLHEIIERDWHKKDDQFLQEENLETKFGLIIDCRMFPVKNNTFAVVFAIPYHNIQIQGTFMSHRFRQNVWKNVLPQMIREVRIKEMEPVQPRKEEQDVHTLS